MRPAGLGTVFAAALLAAGSVIASASAEDGATIPGGARRGPGLERPMRDNPQMRPFLAAAPAAPAAAPAPATTATQAAAPSTQGAVLNDANTLLRRAETAISSGQLPQADADLATAQATLRNARAAGDPVPEQAMVPLAAARQHLRRGQTDAAGHAAEQALALLR